MQEKDLRLEGGHLAKTKKIGVCNECCKYMGEGEHSVVLIYTYLSPFYFPDDEDCRSYAWENLCLDCGQNYIDIS